MFQAIGRLHPIWLILATILGIAGSLASSGPWPYRLAGASAGLASFAVTIGWLRGVFEIMTSRLAEAQRPRDTLWAWGLMSASALIIFAATVLYGDTMERDNGPLSPFVIAFWVCYAAALWQTATAIARQDGPTPTINSRIGYVVVLVYSFIGAWVLRKRLRP